jgi:hypothetical protein
MAVMQRVVVGKTVPGVRTPSECSCSIPGGVVAGAVHVVVPPVPAKAEDVDLRKGARRKRLPPDHAN